MFCLREHIGRNETGVCLAVCDDENFGRACNHVYTHNSEYLAFCFRNENVAGTYDFVNLANRFCTICKRGNSARAAYFIYLIYTSKSRCNEYCGTYYAVLCGSCDNYFGTSCDFSRNRIHKNG